MSIVSDFLEFAKSLIFINDTLKNIKAGNVERDITINLLGEKIIDLDKRTVKLETARDADLMRIEAALSQVAAERKGMAADFERYMNRIENAPLPPQLPPTQPTDN